MTTTTPCSNCSQERLCSSPRARTIVVRAVERSRVIVCPSCGSRREVRDTGTDAESYATCASCAKEPLVIPRLG